MIEWHPWETAPIHDGPITLLVAIDLGGKRGVMFQVFDRVKISTGHMNVIGHHFDFDEETPFAWAYFNKVENIAPKSAK